MPGLSPLWISLKTALTATVIVFFLGIFAAWLMSKYNGRGKGLIDALLTLPMVLPPTVVGYILLLIIGKNSTVGKALDKLGIDIIFTWWAAVLAAAIVSFPLMYKTSVGAFKQIDRNMISAAKTLGASEWKVFWKVAVPLAWPGIAAATMLTYARALGEFGATLMVAGSIPGKTQTMPVAIYFSVESGENRKALIWVLMIFIISLVAMVFTDKLIDKKYFLSSSTRRK